MSTEAVLHQPYFGAAVHPDGVRFRVWAPQAGRVRLVVESGDAAGEYDLQREDTGTFAGRVRGVTAGDLYRFRLDDAGPLPDPASRFQPFDVHGPSEVIDPHDFQWSDQAWRGIDPAAATIYELHIGTFTPEGTFAAAAARLPYLRDLGITVVELMPVADFAGDRNWGYDGVCLFAPARCYGRPDDLRKLVDEAHRLGLAVHLDVVYNHLGPDGAYMSAYTPDYFTARHASAWGEGVNLDGTGSAVVRRFIIENACHWLAEYHLDGLRLDATHALTDDSETHVVAELVSAVRRSFPRAMIVAEDHRNAAEMLREPSAGGWGLDGVWADDFHHIMRRILAGDREGYYEDFEDSVEDLATTVEQGWYYTGQHSAYLGHARGTDPAGIPHHRFVICIQNHDQIGNRAFGERLSRDIDPPKYRAASAVLLLAPGTPLIFMGQEWAASTPFLYFTDHNPELGRLVVEGRRREFQRFSEFRDPATRERIPSPQAPETFEASRLDWDEREREPHRGVLNLYRRLLELRAGAVPVGPAAREYFTARALDRDTLLLRYAPGEVDVVLVARLRGHGTVSVPDLPAEAQVLLTTEDVDFASDGKRPGIAGADIHFSGPAAVLFTVTR
jgi:maltooligosyltrehalose trehalohydrolase